MPKLEALVTVVVGTLTGVGETKGYGISERLDALDEELLAVAVEACESEGMPRTPGPGIAAPRARFSSGAEAR